MIKPKKLEKGDIIAIISPSAGLASIFPHRLDNAIKFFKSQGYKIKEFPCTRKNIGWESALAEERAKDLTDAFKDKEVKAIICSIGGHTSNKILEFLDFEEIKKNAKIFCGYSDISVLHYAINKKSGIVTFYGPAAMTQFGEYPEPLSYTLEYFKKAVSITKPIGKIVPSSEWTDEVLDWGKKEDLTRPRKMVKNKGFEWLKGGEVEGEIIGGCLSSIVHLIGTEYWPEHKNKILFLEIPEGQDITKGLPLAEVDSLLADLRIAKVFEKIKGLIIGRPFRYSEEEQQKFKEIILENTKRYDFPILYGTDIGHTDPIITIPLGVKAKLDSLNNLFSIEERGIEL
jgi:muramoyltetrapeptide carboxypeptidase